MIDRMQLFFSKRYLPRWLVLFFDLFSVLLTFLIAYVLRFNFNLSEAEAAFSFLQFLIIIPVFLFSFGVVRSYAGILRHSTTEDIARIIFSVSIGSAILIVFSYLARQGHISKTMIIPFSVIIIQFAIVSNIMLTSRLLARAIYNEWFTVRRDAKKVMIVGAGHIGQMTRTALMMDTTAKYSVLGFIDNNDFLRDKRIAGIHIYSLKQAFDKIIPNRGVKELIFALDLDSLSQKFKREIVDSCIAQKIEIKEIPPVDKWMNGQLKVSEIKKVNIEDLLGRDEISLDRGRISAGVNEAVVLVAGAAGSIGSEIVRQLISFNAKQVILLDKAESALYDLQNELKHKFKNCSFEVIVGDVTNKANLKRIFEKYLPTIVINAAAYKHVPLMEEFPHEAIRVNVGGTINLANLSVQYNVEKFVFISTDKAVNPTNVMGASKRISEIYIQSLARKNRNGTQFITTRFGNVLGFQWFGGSVV